MVAGPYVFILSRMITPITASKTRTKIMIEAMAMSHTDAPLKKGTRLTKARGALRAVAYSAFVRATPSDERTAATEKPRLGNVLAAVMTAHTQTMLT